MSDPMIDGPSRMLAVRVPQSLSRQLCDLADREGNSVAAVVRRILAARVPVETRTEAL
jgi:predicted HicB family RNase H-like nuclease